MDDGKSVDEIDVKLRLTRLKSFHAECLAESKNQMTTKQGKYIIMSGWKSARMPQAIRTSSVNLETLDLFSNIEPLISEVTHENNINIAEINEAESEAFVNPGFDFYENESDSDEDIYAPECDHRNVFNIFQDIEH